ncbi:hypothetical protein [Methylobacterium sp. WL116]|uniref:hypothetical protein n=1 Tax=Methylobacterium sp. WL116 TaxID=2603889 RepID=UPI0011C7E071|nr:hypothetical protein [Methylobacterium sp. WL116]TXM94307.1 hypothetical protein FV223_05040 [Methylobacterium sp. WL116]
MGDDQHGLGQALEDRADLVLEPSGAPPASEASKASAMKAANEAEMIKAQKASAARDKAWDARTRNSMSSICKGC